MSASEPSRLRPLWRWGLVGAGGALLVALGDFGASWLWLPGWRDRAEFLLRILALEVPIGGLLGASLGAVEELSRPALSAAATSIAGRRKGVDEGLWRARLRPLPYALLTAPITLLVARLLFSGGSMSRLPRVGLWTALSALFLLATTWASLMLGRRYYEAAASAGARRGRWMAAGPLVLFLIVSKLDQHLYPKLYEYLHALLTLVGFCLASLVISLLAEHTLALNRRFRRGGLLAPTLLALMMLVLALDLLTLDSNQNVRVALFDARAASSRSIMLGLDPLLNDAGQRRASHEALLAARRERARRRAARPGGELVRREGAHVLLVTVDALRADHLGAYGYERGLSPALDRFAESSLVFERAYAAAPHSSYSLCSLMVSEYLHETVELGLPLPEATLPGILAEAGYHTAGFYTQGIFHTEGDRLALYEEEAFGFARHDHASMVAERRTDAALAEAERVVRQGEPPSLFWVHYFDVHEPYEETSLGTGEMDRYDGEIRNVDRAFGRLLDEMRGRLEREIIVIVSADHGEEFRDHGGVYHGSTLYEEQIRVPLILHIPDIPPARVQAPVELVDLAPTLLELVGVEGAETMRGDDLRPLLGGEVDGVGPAFASVGSQRMVVRWPHKLVANLRFRLFELYDLGEDPLERRNLAESHPDLLDALEGELYAWLDSLQDAGDRNDPHRRALDLGRLGDPRALAGLETLVRDEDADSASRQEAARILGDMEATEAASALAGALLSPDDAVATECAIALGRIGDERALDGLRRLVFSEDPTLRARSALSLGRLRDPMAVPGLLDALHVSTDRHEREDAVRWLGRIGDRRAVEPLIEMIPEFRVRYLTVVALGELGDPRAFGPLVEILRWETHSNVRDNVSRALGQLGDPRALPVVLPMVAENDDYKYAPEALVRLGAIRRGLIGGVDLAPTTRHLRGFGRCEAGPLLHDTDYLDRTSCETRGPLASMPLRVPPHVAEAEEVAVIIRARRAGERGAHRLRLRVGEEEFLSMEVNDNWAQHRVVVSGASLSRGPRRAELFIEGDDPRVEVDHLLLVPIESVPDGA